MRIVLAAVVSTLRQFRVYGVVLSLGLLAASGCASSRVVNTYNTDKEFPADTDWRDLRVLTTTQWAQYQEQHLTEHGSKVVVEKIADIEAEEEEDLRIHCTEEGANLVIDFQQFGRVYDRNFKPVLHLFWGRMHDQGAEILMRGLAVRVSEEDSLEIARKIPLQPSVFGFSE